MSGCNMFLLFEVRVMFIINITRTANNNLKHIAPWHFICSVNALVNGHSNYWRGRRNTSRHIAQQYQGHDSSIQICPDDSFQTKNNIGKNTNSHAGATSSFFCEMKQPLSASESTPKNFTGKWAIRGSIAQTSGIQKEVKIYESSSASVYTMYSCFYYMHRNLVII